MKEIEEINIDNLHFGDHKIYFIERDNPETLSINYGIKCNGCESYVRTSIKLHDAISKYQIALKLFKIFKEDFSESCLEAKQLGIISRIHNS
jgi:hypothetical protein